MLPHTKRYFRVAVSQMILDTIYGRGLILYARGIRTTSPVTAIYRGQLCGRLLHYFLDERYISKPTCEFSNMYCALFKLKVDNIE